jgi:hypothetical protein
MKYSLLFLALLFSACTVPLRVQMPSSPFIDTSETQGVEHRMKAALQIGMQPRVTLSPDLNVQDANTTNPALDDNGYWYHGAFTFAVSENFDVEGRYPLAARGKFQILRFKDDTENQRGFSLAVSFGAGYVPGTWDSSQQVAGGATQHTTYTIDGLGADVSLQAGYRFHKVILVYAGVIYAYGNATGKYSVDARAIANQNFSINQTSWIPSFGVELKAKQFSFREVNSVIYLTAGQSMNAYGVVGGEVAFSFGGE